ncbi:hypothetical protein PCASD_20495 [Puccinia coronata f. sp. avenae]|nr:hypothetical protein PCASD_20495 [Puccinia coronata f. sp. avenae]
MGDASEHPRAQPCSSNWSKASDTLRTTSTRDHLITDDHGKRSFQYLVAMFFVETFVWGFATSFGVLFNFYRHDPRSPIKSDPNSKLILTLVGTISIGTIAGAAPLVSFWVAKKPGIRRRLMLFGLLTCTLSIFLSSYSYSAFHILLSQGIGYGIGGCALYFSALSHLPEWFEQKRGFATGVVFTGTGTGGLIFPLMLNSLLGRFGAKLALQIVTGLFATPLLSAIFFIRPKLLTSKSNVAHQRCDSLTGQSVPACDKPAPPNPRSFLGDLYRCLNASFWIYVLLNTVQSTVFYLPGLYLPTYIDCLGRSSVTGSTLLSMVNAGTIFAQLAAGFLSDHYSPFLIGAIANALGGASVLIFWGALSHHSIAWLFVFAAA